MRHYFLYNLIFILSTTSTPIMALHYHPTALAFGSSAIGMGLLRAPITNSSLVKKWCLRLNLDPHDAIDACALLLGGWGMSYCARTSNVKNCLRFILPLLMSARLIATTKFCKTNILQCSNTTCKSMCSECKIGQTALEHSIALSYLAFIGNTQHLIKKYIFKEKNNVDEQAITDCSICMENFDNPVKTQCGHDFCFECLYQWLSQNNTCPLCRQYPFPIHVKLNIS